MELTWLGTAGFEIKTNNQVFYLDPYLSRNPFARPRQKKTPDDLYPLPAIFISHGHFDHLMDIPQIVARTGAKVYCSNTAANYLKNKKVPDRAIHPVTCDGEQFSFDGVTARAFFSKHVSFDAKLVLSTLLKINVNLFSCLPLFTHFPCGQVLGWRLDIENTSILFYGSAGASRNELEQTAKTPVDILLLPLQGHSDICTIGLEIVKCLQPKIVIPHHHDNFYPPISQQIDIRPFVDNIHRVNKKTRVIEPEINKSICL